MNAADVVIVGGGPVGLMLACELRLHKVEVVLLEQNHEVLPDMGKSGCVHARTLELFDQRGFADEVMAAEGSPSKLCMVSLDEYDLDLNQLPYTRFPYAFRVRQWRIETILEERAAKLGAQIRRGHEFIDLHQDAAMVRVEVLGPAGPYRVDTRYLVACDGGRSTVRKKAGFAFPGTTSSTSMPVGDVRLAHPPDEEMINTRTPDGMYGITSFNDGFHRVFVADEQCMHPDDPDAPLAMQELADALQRVTGKDHGVLEARRLARVGNAARQADPYRLGRVFIAGDAAHVHWPATGQGMNTGLQDAVNLGWKLAADITGWAPAGLLDSYHAERHPVGASMLFNSRFQERLGLDLTEDGILMREMFARLIALPAVNRLFSGWISGMDYEYPRAPDGYEDPHPLCGKPVSSWRFFTADCRQVHLADLLHDARPLVIDLTRPHWLPADCLAGWRDRVNLIGADLVEFFAHPVDLLLIRPDGHVAWAGAGLPAPELQAQLRAALGRWCGQPSDHGAGER